MNRRTLFFVITLLISINVCFGQSQGNSPRGTWGEWHVVYSEQPNLKVEICFNTSTCKNGTLIGYSYYRIRSNFNRPNAWVKFSFEAIGCDGITHTTPINYKLDRPGLTDNLGDWFSGYEVRRINGATYTDNTPKNKSVSNPDLDQAKQTFDAAKTSYTNKLGKIQNQQLKQQYEAALQNTQTQFSNGYQLAQQYAQQGNAQNLQSQLSYLQKVNKQLDDNYNLMNDVVERQAGIPATKNQPVVKTAAKNGFDTQKPYTENASALQNNLNVNAQVNQELGNLVDKYLIDKDKLKDNALASASLDFAKKAQLATNRSDIEVNTVAAGVLGLAALFTNNRPAKVGFTEEEIEQRKNDLIAKVEAARPYYLDVVQKSVYDLLEELKNTPATDAKKMISIIHKLYGMQEIAYEIKATTVCVDRVNRISYYIYPFDKELLKLKEINNEIYNVTWEKFKDDKFSDASIGFFQRKVENGGNVFYMPVPSNNGVRKKIMNNSGINSYFVAANYYIKDKNPMQVYEYLKKIDDEKYQVDTLNDDSVKNNYFIHYHNDYQYKGISQTDFYSFGALGLKKIVATNLLGDMVVDSAVLFKNTNKLPLGIGKMTAAYKWFSDNLMTSKSPNYENDGHQFDILNGLFKDYIDATALLLTYSTDEEAKKQTLEILANDMLSYINYSAKKIPRTETRIY